MSGPVRSNAFRPALCAAVCAVTTTLAACAPPPTGGTPVGDASATTAADLPASRVAATGIAATEVAPPTAAPTVRATATSAGEAHTAAPAATPEMGVTIMGGRIGDTFSLREIRVGEHDGFTRVVWEMTEATGTPRYTVVQYDNRSDPPDGGVVPGAARLEVTLTDTYGYDVPVGAMSLDAPDSPVVLGVTPLPALSDSHMRFAVALARAARFEVTALETPVRLVVDVFGD